MSDTVFDRVVRHQTKIERVKAGESDRINKIIIANDNEIISILSKIPKNYTKSQIDNIVAEIINKNNSYYSEIVLAALTDISRSIVDFETDFSVETVNNFFDKEVKTVAPQKDKIFEDIQKTKYDKHKLATWVALLGRDKNKRIEREIKTAVLNNETPDGIISSARNAMRVSNSNNDSVTKAYINQSVNFSRDAVYSANDEKVNQIIWSSILDSGTTLTCGVRSNKRYDAKTKRPIGHSNEWNGGPGVIHWGCRSLAIPVDENDVISSGTGEGFVFGSGDRTAIGADSGYERGDNKKTDGKRFRLPSKNNKLRKDVVSAKTDYETWLKRQPRAFVEDTLGVTRASAFLNGEASLGDFVVQNGRKLSVKELEKSINLGEN